MPGHLDEDGDDAALVRALNASHVVAVFDGEGAIVSANANFRRAFGFVDPKAGWPAEFSEFWPKLRRGEAHVGEYGRAHKDGRDVRLRATYTPETDQDGHVRRIVMIANEIEVEREPSRQFEMRLRCEIERRMAATPGMMHSIDEKGRLIAVSDAWLVKLGYSRGEVLGRLSSEFLTPESRERAIKEIVPEFFRVGHCENVQYRMVKKDGGVIDVLFSGVLADAPSGMGRESLAVITDITALVEARRLLAMSEARYRGLVEDQSEMVSLSSPEGQISFVNAAYASRHGQRPEAMVGRNLFEFVPIEERAALAQHMARVRATQASLESENQLVLPGGERRWFGWTNRALCDNEGRITGIHSVGRDIHDRVLAERRLQESEARYRFLAENSNDLILLVAEDGSRLYASPASRKLLGYEPEEAIEIRLQDAIHPDDARRVLDILATRPTDSTLSYRMRHKDGHYVWVETTGKTVELANHRRQRLIIVRDIEQRIEAEQRVKASEARYRLLADNSSDMVFQLDRSFVRRYVSPACREIIGYEPEDLVGVKPTDMTHPEDAARVALAFDSLMRGITERLSVVNRVAHKDGRWIWVEAQARALKDAQTGETIGIIGALRDVSLRKAIEDELAEANSRLKVLAGQDALTGLANRRMFDEALASAFRRALRDSVGVALIMIDVDRFKNFNDCYGHPAGDACLKSIADAIAASVRQLTDVAARYGGEEFAVVLLDADEIDASTVANRIQQAVLRLQIVHKGSEKGIVTVSAGVAAACAATPSKSQDTLVRRADTALYTAKKQGRNLVAVASASNDPVDEAEAAA